MAEQDQPEDDGPEPMPADPIDPGSDLRFYVRTVVEFLEVKPKITLTDNIEFAYECTAVAMLNSLRGLFVSTIEAAQRGYKNATDSTRAGSDPRNVRAGSVGERDSD